MPELQKVTVYCGSRLGSSDKWRKAAENFAECLADEGLDMVFGGSSSGLMGIVSGVMMQKGREVIGVIPKNFNSEVKSVGISKLIETKDYAVRKKTMNELGDAFIALPGGTGTWDEIIEISVFVRLGYYNKPVGLLNAYGYYDPMKLMLEQAYKGGFLSRADNPMIFEEDPKKLIQKLRDWVPAESLDKGRVHHEKMTEPNGNADLVDPTK